MRKESKIEFSTILVLSATIKEALTLLKISSRELFRLLQPTLVIVTVVVQEMKSDVKTLTIEQLVNDFVMFPNYVFLTLNFRLCEECDNIAQIPKHNFTSPSSQIDQIDQELEEITLSFASEG